MRGYARIRLAATITAVLLVAGGCGREHRMGGAYWNQDLSRESDLKHSLENNQAGVNAYGVDGGNDAAARRFDINAKAADAPELAQALTAMAEIREAQVILIDSVAYAAIVPDYGPSVSSMDDTSTHHAVPGDVPETLKGRIVAKLKAADPRVERVYASANPDYVERIRNFSDQLRAGRPVNGFLQDFGPLVNRLFPGQ